MQVFATLFVLLSALAALSFAGVVRLPLHRYPTQHEDPLAHGAEVKHSQLLYRPQNDTRFYSYFHMGTPSRGMKVIIRTSGSEFWVPSLHCKTTVCLMRQFTHNYYNRDESSSYSRTGKRFFIQYPQGVNVSGPIVKETISIGGLEIKNQEVGEAVFIEGAQYLKYEWDGIMGFGKNSATNGMTPVFSNLISQGLISQPIFSYYINRDRMAGELILGGTDNRIHVGPLNYFSLLDDIHWAVPMQSITVGDSTYCKGGCPLKIDTGSRFINGPVDEIQKLNKQIGATRWENSQVFLVPCDTIPTLPTITFNVNGHSFPLTPEEYITKESKYELGLTFCTTGFMEKHTNTWTVGEPFNLVYYTQFDYGKKRIGIARQQTV